MRNDSALLLDMLIALEKIARFVQGLNEDDFLTNDLVQSAVIREFQVLGEAARLISPEAKASTPAIPWALIAGMRNRLIHEYFDVRLDVVWTTIQRDLPQLTSQIAAALPPQSTDEAP
jgi:uncharacterized protein with HEPN domain